MAFTDRPRLVRASALADTELDPSPLADDQLPRDHPPGTRPDVRILELHDADDLLVGVWQHGTGASRDVESDEVFVVLRAGRPSNSTGCRTTASTADPATS